MGENKTYYYIERTPEIHLFDCTADVWEMIIPFIIQMNEESADERNVGSFKSKSAFPNNSEKGKLEAGFIRIFHFSFCSHHPS